MQKHGKNSTNKTRRISAILRVFSELNIPSSHELAKKKANEEGSLTLIR